MTTPKVTQWRESSAANVFNWAALARRQRRAIPRGSSKLAVNSSCDRASGFSLLELLILVAVTAVIVALALPSVMNSLKNYRLNADAASTADYLNVARMRAASQFAPYRVNVSTTTSSFNMEKLCGATATSVDPACTGPYSAFSTPQIELGTQFANQEDTYASCRPSGVTSYPGSITADASGCPNLVQFYFNTRGAPVDGAGNPLSNGGAVVYLSNTIGLVDAVTVSLGGSAAAWTWIAGEGKWVKR